MSKAETLTSRNGFRDISLLRRLLKSFWDFLPFGGSLPADVWQSRHRFLLGLTWFHALLIALIGPVLGYSWELSSGALFRDDTVLHTIAEGAVVAFFAGIATWGITRREIRATAVGFGLMSASAILVHFSGGYIELHFHFFVMLAFLALYQDWVPYLLAIVYVAIHHGVVGVMWPQEVYNHTAAINAPWTWAGIHAFFVLWAAVGSLIAWRFNEKAFAQSKLILDSAGEGIYGLDRDGKVAFINPAAASLLRWQAKEAIGKAMHQVLRHTRSDGSDFSDHTSPILAALRDGARRQATDELFRRQDGTSFPVDYVCTPIFEREELTGVVVTFRDISRRNQRELALRESDARKRAILESALDAIISIDHEGKIIEFNPAAEKTFGYSRSETMGKTMADLIIPPSLRQAHNRGLAHFLASGQGPVLGKRIELTAMRADGSEFPAELTITPIDTGRLPIFTGFVRDITERKQAEEDLQNRYKEVAILHDVSQMTLGSTDLKAVLEKILDRTLSVVSLDLGNIRLFDSSGQMRMSVYRGYRDPESIREHHADVKGPASGVLTSRVFASEKSLVVEDVTTTEGLRTLKKEGACSAIVVPIMTQEETLGAIEVGRRTPNKFRPDDVRLLEAIGNQVGMAVQKVRLTEETERRAHEQEALNIIAKSISQSLRRDELLNIALDKVLEVTGRERVSIRLKDSTTGQVTLAAHRGFSQEEIDDLLQRTRHQATEQVLASGQPLVVNNRQEVNDTQSLLPQSRSVAWIPMKAGARVVGILGISASSPVPFSEREVEFLQAIANMIGVALENARLFQETERRNRELSALYAALAPFALADADQVLQKVVERLKEATQADAALIRIFDKETKSFLYPAHVGFSSGYLEATRDLEQDPAIGTAFMTEEPIIAANIAEDSRLKDKRQVEAGFGSCAFLPLRISGELRAIIHLASRKIGHFSAEKTAHLMAIARQMAITIENVELFQDAERRAREQAALNVIAQAISQSLRADELLDIAMDKVIEVSGRERGSIRLKDPVTGKITLAAHRGLSQEEIEGLVQTVSGQATDQVFASGQPLIVNARPEVQDSRSLLPQSRSVAWIPMKAGAKVVGVLCVSTTRPIPFVQREVEFLQAIANMIGVALENARLFQETERRNRELQSLYAVASTVGQSLHIDTLMQAALKTIIEVLEVDAGQLYVLDEKNHMLRLAAHYGLPIDQLSHVESYAPGQGIIGRIFEEKRSLAFADITSDPSYQAAARGAKGLSWGFRSAAGLPITIGLRPIGVIYVYGRTVREFNAQDIELLSAMGGQIGFAIENARLFSETEARYRQLQTLHAISDTILESLDLRIMMERILDQAFEIGNFDIGVVRLLDSTGESLAPVASRGYRNPTNVEAHSKKLEGYTNGAGSARVIDDNTVHVVDLTQTSGMRTFRREEVSVIVAVPLRSHEEVLGVMQLGSRAQREFQESELRILDAIGGQAGIAIQKARLHENTQRAQAALAQKAAELARSNSELQHFTEEIKVAKEKLEKVNSVLTVQAAELAHSNTELEQFAYIASHDLQEPLRMVASYVQLLARRYKGKLEAEADEFIGFAVDGAKRMQELINALLVYSRIGTKGKEFGPIDCETVLQIALKNLQIAIEDSQAMVTYDALPTIRGDTTQLGQLFQNLIGNAIKFRGDKRPAVHVSAERNGKEWGFSFRDDGIGIDSQYAERIFVIFQRLHSKEEYPGTGIGLALCRKIVERHGGRIWVESEPGKGSTFRFSMPA